MAYPEFLLSTPYSFVALAGIAAGVGVGGIIPGRRFRFSDEAMAARRLTRLYLSLAGMLVFGLAGFFLPGPERFLELGLLWTFLAVLALATAALRFPRAAGLPLLVLVIALGVISYLVRQSWTPVRPPADVASLQVLRAGGGVVALEYGRYEEPQVVPAGNRSGVAERPGVGQPSGVAERPGRNESDATVRAGAEIVSRSFVRLSGTAFVAEADLLAFAPYHFFVGMDYGFRVVAVESPGGDRMELEPAGEGLAARALRVLRRSGNSLPGIRITRMRSSEVTPVPLERYVLRVETDGIRFVPHKSFHAAGGEDDT